VTGSPVIWFYLKVLKIKAVLSVGPPMTFQFSFLRDLTYFLNCSCENTDKFFWGMKAASSFIKEFAKALCTLIGSSPKAPGNPYNILRKTTGGFPKPV
jgi:hypothetical protein